VLGIKSRHRPAMRTSARTHYRKAGSERVFYQQPATVHADQLGRLRRRHDGGDWSGQLLPAISLGIERHADLGAESHGCNLRFNYHNSSLDALVRRQRREPLPRARQHRARHDFYQHVHPRSLRNLADLHRDGWHAADHQSHVERIHLHALREKLWADLAESLEERGAAAAVLRRLRRRRVARATSKEFSAASPPWWEIRSETGVLRSTTSPSSSRRGTGCSTSFVKPICHSTKPSSPYPECRQEPET